MACLRIVAVSICLILVMACTVPPENYKSVTELLGQSAIVRGTLSDNATDNAKTQAVAAASIGVAEIYIDNGKSVELIVQSEYFSANGRTCRRYSETVNGQSVQGVSCQDDVRGWVDLPLSSFVR